MDRFLERAAHLAPTAWAEIEAETRRPVRSELSTLWAGLTMGARRLTGGRTTPYSARAALRVRTFVESGGLPPKSGWRAVTAVGNAVQALALESRVDRATHTALYAPFERHIPVASLRELGSLD